MEASSNHVFWLADDDLWFPGHVERLGELLERAHLATSLVVSAWPDGSVGVKPFDLGLPKHREALAVGKGFLPMATLAHRRKAYLKLPLGWRIGVSGRRASARSSSSVGAVCWRTRRSVAASWRM